MSNEQARSWVVAQEVVKPGRTLEETMSSTHISPLVFDNVFSSCCMYRPADLFLSAIKGLDLLVKMLKINPKNRITVGEALEHPYFREPVSIRIFSMLTTIIILSASMPVLVLALL